MLSGETILSGRNAFFLAREQQLEKRTTDISEFVSEQKSLSDCSNQRQRSPDQTKCVFNEYRSRDKKYRCMSGWDPDSTVSFIDTVTKKHEVVTFCWSLCNHRGAQWLSNNELMIYSKHDNVDSVWKCLLEPKNKSYEWQCTSKIEIDLYNINTNTLSTFQGPILESSIWKRPISRNCPK